jgi:hypothetical protein
MFVCCECCVLSGGGLCDELITRPEESYRLWRIMFDLETLKNEEAMTRIGSQRHKKILLMLPVSVSVYFCYRDVPTQRNSGTQVCGFKPG